MCSWLCQVVFYDGNGRDLQTFDYSNDDGARAFTCCCFNPSGDVAVAGAFNRFYMYCLNPAKGAWEQVHMQQVGWVCGPCRQLLSRALQKQKEATDGWESASLWPDQCHHDDSKLDKHLPCQMTMLPFLQARGLQ